MEDDVCLSEQSMSHSRLDAPPLPPPSIVDLPAELLLAIFHQCGTDSIGFERPANCTSWYLSTVCKQWRELVNSQPTLWTRLRIGPSSKVNALKLALIRSAELPLYIKIVSTNDTPSWAIPIFDILAPHQGRIQEASVIGILHGTLPNTTKLSVTPLGVFAAEPASSGLIETLQRFNDATHAQIRDLTIERIMIPKEEQDATIDGWAGRLRLAFPWERLTRLHFKPNLRGSTLSELLPQWHTLDELIIQGSIVGDVPRSSNPITLPNLSVLCLSKGSAQLLKNVICPSLRRLDVPACGLTLLLQSFKRCPFKLEYLGLNLEQSTSVPLEWEVLCASFHELETLNMWGGVLEQDDREWLAFVGISSSFPALEHLDVGGAGLIRALKELDADAWRPSCRVLVNNGGDEWLRLESTR